MLGVAVAGALALGGCITPTHWEAVQVLQDIRAGEMPSRLKESVPVPSREEIRYAVDGREMVADLYHPNQSIGAPLVLVPGFTADGKDDRRLVALARTLARARFLVLVPDLEGSRTLRVRREDARAIADAVLHLTEKAPDHDAAGVLAISYAVGLAVLASQKEDATPAFDFLVGIGGYYDSEAVITFSTTGGYRDPSTGRWHQREPRPFSKWVFLLSKLDTIADAGDREILEEIAMKRLDDPQADIEALAGKLGAGGRELLALITNTDPERVPELIAGLPDAIREGIEELSLAGRDLSHLAGRLILIHGREDDMIPYGESIRLAEAAPGSDLHLISGFSHIGEGRIGFFGQLQLVDAATALLRRRDGD